MYIYMLKVFWLELGPKDYIQLGGCSYGDKGLHLQIFLGELLLKIEVQYIPIHCLV